MTAELATDLAVLVLLLASALMTVAVLRARL